ncbi:hypothetical protein KFE25_002650 [Diacronema lutheri]|uniref:Phosphodiesterase n=2 Tax=Diacronema lutheri TaxID=2081491 RepID=A0A8J5XIV8_DIALT|nr:hypothetical protein KFE25_002650 [Diacronema lutheri]
MVAVHAEGAEEPEGAATSARAAGAQASSFAQGPSAPANAPRSAPLGAPLPPPGASGEPSAPARTPASRLVTIQAPLSRAADGSPSAPFARLAAGVGGAGSVGKAATAMSAVQVLRKKRVAIGAGVATAQRGSHGRRISRAVADAAAAAAAAEAVARIGELHGIIQGLRALTPGGAQIRPADGKRPSARYTGVAESEHAVVIGERHCLAPTAFLTMPQFEVSWQKATKQLTMPRVWITFVIATVIAIAVGVWAIIEIVPDSADAAARRRGYAVIMAIGTSGCALVPLVAHRAHASHFQAVVNGGTVWAGAFVIAFAAFSGELFSEEVPVLSLLMIVNSLQLRASSLYCVAVGLLLFVGWTAAVVRVAPTASLNSATAGAWYVQLIRSGLIFGCALFVSAWGGRSLEYEARKGFLMLSLLESHLRTLDDELHAELSAAAELDSATMANGAPHPPSPLGGGGGSGALPTLVRDLHEPHEAEALRPAWRASGMGGSFTHERMSTRMSGVLASAFGGGARRAPDGVGGGGIGGGEDGGGRERRGGGGACGADGDEELGHGVGAGGQAVRACALGGTATVGNAGAQSRASDLCSLPAGGVASVVETAAGERATCGRRATTTPAASAISSGGVGGGGGGADVSVRVARTSHLRQSRSSALCGSAERSDRFSHGRRSARLSSPIRGTSASSPRASGAMSPTRRGASVGENGEPLPAHRFGDASSAPALGDDAGADGAPAVVVDLESPIVKIQALLDEIAANFDLSPEELALIDEVRIALSLNGASSVFAPNLNSQLTGSTLDTDLKSWLFYEVAKGQQPTLSAGAGAGGASGRAGTPPGLDGAGRGASEVGALKLPGAGTRSTPLAELMAGRTESELVELLVARPGLGLKPDELEQLDFVRVRMHSWEFETEWKAGDGVGESDRLPGIFAGYERCGSRLMAFAMIAAFESFDLLRTLAIPDVVFASLLDAIERSYYDSVPYHCLLHAVDAMHSTFWLLRHGGVDEGLGKEHIFAMLFAAICHDISHPGKNNAFCVQSRAHLALLYNDRSVLENMHASTTIRLLSRPEFEPHLLGKLSADEGKAVRETVIESILATDMAVHFDNLGKFSAQQSQGFDLARAAERNLKLSTLVHLADVATPSKTWGAYKRWLPRLFQEFFDQGDIELAKGLPVAPFMDRRVPAPAKSQIGFCQFIVQPLFDAVSATVPQLEAKLENVETSLHFLKLWAELGPIPWPDAEPGAPAAEPPGAPVHAGVDEASGRPAIFWHAGKEALVTRVPGTVVPIVGMNELMPAPAAPGPATPNATRLLGGDKAGGPRQRTGVSGRFSGITGGRAAPCAASAVLASTGALCAVVAAAGAAGGGDADGVARPANGRT